MVKKKRLVVNVSEDISDSLWLLHCEQKISQSRIVERILEDSLAGYLEVVRAEKRILSNG
jgi:hypothetical protein